MTSGRGGLWLQLEEAGRAQLGEATAKAAAEILALQDSIHQLQVSLVLQPFLEW